MRRNNIARARKIFALIREYSGKNEEPRTHVIDVLVDLRHLCEMNKLNFEELDHCAGNHYRAECLKMDDPNFVKPKKPNAAAISFAVRVGRKSRKGRA